MHILLEYSIFYEYSLLISFFSGTGEVFLYSDGIAVYNIKYNKVRTQNVIIG